jgi:hypothetical protein
VDLSHQNISAATVADLLHAFRTCTQIGQTVRAHAQTGLTHLLSARHSESIPAGRTRLTTQMALALAAQIPAAGWLAADPKLELAARDVRRFHLRTHGDTPNARGAADNYVSAFRQMIEWADEQGYRVWEPQGVCEMATSPRVRKAKLTPVTNYMLALRDTPFRVWPWSARDRSNLETALKLAASGPEMRARLHVCRASITALTQAAQIPLTLKGGHTRLQQLQRECRSLEKQVARITAAESRVDEIRRTRWPQVAQDIWDDIIRWATVDRERGYTNHAQCIKPITAEGWAKAVASYIGYLINVNRCIRVTCSGDEVKWEIATSVPEVSADVIPSSPIAWRTFEAQDFWTTLQNEEWLLEYVRWMEQRHADARNNAQIVPYTIHNTLTVVGTIVREYWFQHKQGQQPAAMEVAARHIRDTFAKRPTAGQRTKPAMLAPKQVLTGAQRIWDAAMDESSPVQSATMKRDALMIALPMFLPLRQVNWRTARYGTNIIRGKNGGYRLHFTKDTVKNSKSIGCEVPKMMWAALDDYLGIGECASDARNLIIHCTPSDGSDPLPSSDLMFPTKGGRELSSGIYTRIIAEWTSSPGVLDTRINPHLMRDIVASFLINEYDDWVGASQVLGDTLATTLRHYAHLAQDAAIQRSHARIAESLRSTEEPREPYPLSAYMATRYRVPPETRGVLFHALTESDQAKVREMDVDNETSWGVSSSAA